MLFNAGWLKLDSGESTSSESNQWWYSFCRSVLFDTEEMISNASAAICTILSSDCKLLRLSDHANISCLVCYICEVIDCFMTYGYPDERTAKDFHRAAKEIERASGGEIKFGISKEHRPLDNLLSGYVVS